jgi:integrase
VEIFTKQEAAEMLAYLENEPLQYRALIQVAIMTGARRGELVALKFSDIDRSSCRITIERAAVKVKGEPLRTKPPKDFEVRSVTVPQYCIDLLDDLKAEKRREAARLGDAWHYDDYVFTQFDDSMMNPDTVTKWFSGFLSKNGLKHRKFHSLRHTSATLLLYGGASIKQVQGRLGHGDIETTNKYLHYIAEADSESANILQNMLITHKKTDDKEELKQA